MQVFRHMGRYNIEILVIGEARWNGNSEITTNGYKFIYLCKEIESRDHQYGVAIILSNKAEKALRDRKLMMKE